MWFSTPSFWIGGGLESRCVDRVYGADGAAVRLGISLYFMRKMQVKQQSSSQLIIFARSASKQDY